MDIKKIFIFGLMLALANIFENVFADTLLTEDFSYPNGLITNEFAFWNPNLSQSKKSLIWEATSGSLFANSDAGWTGVPNNITPNATSSNGNNSAIFRLRTKRSDFGDVEVTISLLNQGLTSTSSTPPVGWDGFHLWLRYQSETNLYYASVNRRDNTVIIKKKIPGGPSNGGTYYNLTPYVPHVVPYNTWQLIRATVKNNADGSVTIKLYSGGTLLVSATDNGTIGGSPITHAGKVGMRGDNANLKFDNFSVATLASDVPSPPVGVAAAPSDTEISIGWQPATGATSYNVYRSRFPGVTKTNGFKIPNVSSPFLNTGLTDGTTYYMVVTAVNSAGESHESVEVSAAPVLTVPAAPKNVKASAGNSKVFLSWQTVPGATSYNCYWLKHAGVTKATGNKVANLGSNPYTDGGHANGVMYFYVVTAVNSAGESPESMEVSTMPYSGGPAAPFSINPTISSGGLNSLRIYPNPWRSDHDGAIPVTFNPLSPDASVKIFTLSGQCVATLPTSPSSATWDLRNGSGEKVASGLYIYLVNDGGEKKHGTLAIIQ